MVGSSMLAGLRKALKISLAFTQLNMTSALINRFNIPAAVKPLITITNTAALYKLLGENTKDLPYGIGGYIKPLLAINGAILTLSQLPDIIAGLTPAPPGGTGGTKTSTGVPEWDIALGIRP